LNRLAALAVLLLVSSPCFAEKTYTNPFFLYAIDYPDGWKLKEIGKVALFMSPQTKEDKFSENVDVVAEDLRAAGKVSLIDYHRTAIGKAPQTLQDFELVEETQVTLAGHAAIQSMYIAVVHGEVFRFRSYTVLAGETAYVLTYKGRKDDFDRFLPEAEKLIQSLRVSP
jgi:eukaryotic-like serine/threonine-protein kinase